MRIYLIGITEGGEFSFDNSTQSIHLLNRAFLVFPRSCPALTQWLASEDMETDEFYGSEYD